MVHRASVVASLVTGEGAQISTGSCREGGGRFASQTAVPAELLRKQFGRNVGNCKGVHQFCAEGDGAVRDAASCDERDVRIHAEQYDGRRGSSCRELWKSTSSCKTGGSSCRELLEVHVELQGGPERPPGKLLRVHVEL